MINKEISSFPIFAQLDKEDLFDNSNEMMSIGDYQVSRAYDERAV